MARFKRHSRAKNPTMLVGRAIKKFGPDKSILKTLVIANDWYYLCELEKHAISAYKTKMPHGYNMTDGGDGMVGHVWSKEARDKVSKFHKGRKKSDKERANMSAAQKGKPKNWTPEWKENVRRANSGNTWSVGLKRSDNTKQKQSSKKKSWWSGLTDQEKKEFIAARAEAQRQKGGFKAAAEGAAKWWASLTAEERKDFCKRRSEKQMAKKRGKKCS